ncbi:flagellar hook-associated protein FlgL [Uliginosibacterium sp. H3]|uniref:Flagellar hook-associated protein FlgL n=1 Tax=Uliginosibacterium silvisoli TaxID=3114758 RepID=A0ABU6K883_9RHOO|nr:flagellar hook-associated protein FlgL [Uliginosibacterium sp. H3]
MRISTAQIYDTNVGNITRQQSDLLKLQNQLSTGKRVVTPSDDPIAAARALEVSQSAQQVQLQKEAQGTANDKLSSLDSRLGSISDLFAYVHERAIQAGSATLNQSDRDSIAADMQAQFDSLMSMANATDENGEYMFSGYKGDVQPFTGSLTGVSYAGDQGQRTVHVSSSRNIPVSLSGDELLMRIRTSGQSFNAQPSIGNTGTGTVSSSTVVGTYAGGQYGIRFTSATTYDVFDRAADPAMTGAAMASGTYTAGAPINLPPAPATAEIQVTLNGAPATNDSFAVNPSAGTTDAFTMISDFITNLRTGGSGPAYYAAIQDTMSLADSAQENVLRLRAQTGSHQLELDSLGSVADDLSLQYADRTQRLIGVDYASAISDFQLQNTFLEASRNTFVKTTNLSLFSFLS